MKILIDFDISMVDSPMNEYVLFGYLSWEQALRKNRDNGL